MKEQIHGIPLNWLFYSNIWSENKVLLGVIPMLGTTTIPDIFYSLVKVFIECNFSFEKQVNIINNNSSHKDRFIKISNKYS